MRNKEKKQRRSQVYCVNVTMTKRLGKYSIEVDFQPKQSHAILIEKKQ